MENEHGHDHAMHGDHMNHEMPAEKRGLGGWHWACCLGPMFSWLLWLAAATSLVLAWVSVIRVQLVWNLGPDWWLWNALVFGVLALPGCGKRVGWHGKKGVCMAHGAKCCCC